MSSELKINSIRDISNFSIGGKKGISNEKAEKPFGDVLKESIGEVNRLQNEAEKAAKDLALGRAENIHDVMISMEKASVSFRLMMQVRNKIIEAYQEVMRMQV
ncbi:MAG: flagellar hook-basal body complex protein FliE [Nitrospinae bacterium]|nr:flagellar hook-basal body complex protein FliE [Nitrospinota bacterium]